MVFLSSLQQNCSFSFARTYLSVVRKTENEKLAFSKVCYKSIWGCCMRITVLNCTFFVEQQKMFFWVVGPASFHWSNKTIKPHHFLRKIFLQFSFVSSQSKVKALQVWYSKLDFESANSTLFQPLSPIEVG